MSQEYFTTVEWVDNDITVLNYEEMENAKLVQRLSH